MPPIFGGKSFVTRRCFIWVRSVGSRGLAFANRRGELGLHVRIGVGVGQQVVQAEARRGPHGVGAQHRVVVRM